MVNNKIFLSFTMSKYVITNTSTNSKNNDNIKKNNDFFLLIIISVLDNIIPKETKKNAKNKPFRVVLNILIYL